MEQFNELLAKLKELSILQTKGDWAENIPADIWEQYFEANFTEVEYNIDVYTHRWYETSITVIEIYGRLLGIRYITNMFSESQDFEDCYVHIEFMEMKKIQITSYTKA